MWSNNKDWIDRLDKVLDRLTDNIALGVKFQAHTIDCDRRYRELAELQKMRHEENTTSLKEMEERITRRLNKQDTMTLTVAGTLILLLLSVIGFFVSHQGVPWGHY